MGEPSGAEPPPSRGLSPAGWTAVSAIAVAVIGAVATLLTAWWQRTPPAPAKAAPPAASAPATQASSPGADPQAWAGDWAGTIRDPAGPAFRLEVHIVPGCVAGAVCGTIRVPHVPCTGELSLVEVRGQVAEFSVDHFDARSDPKACQPGAGETFQAGPDGVLDYTATYSGAHGQLKKSE